MILYKKHKRKGNRLYILIDLINKHFNLNKYTYSEDLFV